jgi:hypothetical protein
MPASWTAREVIGWDKTGRPAGDAPIPFLFGEDQLDAWQRNIVAQVQDMAEAAAVEALQQTTQQAIQEVIARETGRSGGIAPLYRQVIDGVQDAPLTAIHPDSAIVLLWNYTPEVAARTYEALVQRSPRRSGRYIEGLLMFVDGTLAADYRAVTLDTKEVMLVASVAYARRLEVGKDIRGHPFVKQVAPHIVEETAIVAKRKFGDLDAITYQYVDLAGAHQLTAQGMIPRHFEQGRWRHGHTPRLRHGMLESQVRYPAILITPIE